MNVPSSGMAEHCNGSKCSDIMTHKKGTQTIETFLEVISRDCQKYLGESVLHKGKGVINEAGFFIQTRL